MLLVAGLFVSACTGTAPQPPPDLPQVFVTRIDQILANQDVNEAQREALADYVVTDAEYATARQQLVGCVTLHGIDIELMQEGFSVGLTQKFSARFESQDEADAAMTSIVEECMIEHLHHLEFIYTDSRNNPQALSFIEAVRACTDRLGLTEGRDLSDDELQDRLDADEAYLFECRVDPWTVARDGELPYDLTPPPGAKP